MLAQQALAAMSREQMEALILPAMAEKMGASAEMLAPMLAGMTDDQLRAQMAPAVQAQIKQEAAAKIAGMT